MTSKLEAFADRLAGRSGRSFWRALDELADSPAFQQALEAEYPAAFGGVADVERRGVLKALAASLALGGVGGLGACSARADREALPYVDAPEFGAADRPKLYATAVTLGGYAQPVLGRTHAGRPTKLEGLAGHPASGGATDAYTQASLLGLYDPDRSQAPQHLASPAAWSALETALVDNAARMDSRRGEGFRLLTGAQTSPTLLRQLDGLMRRWPLARWHVSEPAALEPSAEAARLVFGAPLRPSLQLQNAQAVVSLDHDLLGPGPYQTLHARAWGARRRAFQAGDGGALLFMAEPTPSLTGAIASDRLIVSHQRIGVLASALLAAIDGAASPVALSPAEQRWVRSAARALLAAGPAGLVSVGPQHPVQAQATGLTINARLGALGRCLTLSDPVQAIPPDGDASLAVLAADMAAGRVDTLAIVHANPAYAAPADLNFVAAMDKVRLRIHAGLCQDETASLCHWHAPLQHDLETWSDARSVDGLVSLIQPLVRPFYDVRSQHVFVQNLLGDLTANDREVVAATWREAWGDGFADRWRAALLEGYVRGSAPAAKDDAAASPPLPATPAPAAGRLTAIFRPDPSLWDGRFANNPWLQELPKPLNKVTWDNVVAVSPALASAERLSNGDIVKVEAAGRSLRGAVWITPGQEADTVTLHLGYGRRLPDQLGDAHGYDAYALRTSASPWMLAGARLSRTGEKTELATTQLHTALRGFDFVRTVPAGEASTQRRGPSKAERNPTYYAHGKPESPAWGMSIDTDLCIGCNACVTACVAENNIAMVGKDQVAKGREMHWLRIDLYHEGPADDPAMIFQPVPCMHCEDAPCEMGCPVNATVHSPDGLNLQVYNRCIGTRTCSSFCPYKVRRFNWFDLTEKDPPELQAARNPNVTVRSRGVMEKCTYCIQRISDARIEAKKEGRPIREGEVRTACQQACPTNAIVFGDIADPKSEVSRRKRLSRDYTLLEEANTRPRTTYLAKVDPKGGGGGEES